MMRWSLFSFRILVSLSFLLAGVVPLPAAANVVINEIYYDHPGRDEGWEFVELLNAGPSRVELAGWSLEFLDGVSGRGTTIWTAPAGSGIESGEILCVAGVERHPAAGCELRSSLGNGPDAVRLRSPAGTIDLVGYGPCSLPDLFETSPAPDAAAGSSLARKPDGSDSGRNDADFVVAAPTPGRRNFYARDLEASLRPPSTPPCVGGTASLVVAVTNRGIEPVAGIATMRVLIRSGNFTGDSAIVDVAVDLSTGESDSTIVSLAAPPSARFEAEVSLVCGFDENPANDAAVIAVGASPGEAVVNEIMYRPDEGGSEWIEIYFPGSGCDLAGWTVGDASGSRRLVAGDSLHAAGGSYLILARDSAAFAARYPSCPAAVRSPAGGWAPLNDYGDDCADVVFLHDGNGVCVERAAYPDLVGSERGRSIERLSPLLCSSAREGLWHRSAARDRATPGAPNSTAIDRKPLPASVSVVPNPFAPRSGASAVISGFLAAGETGFRVRIFSLAGIELRRLFGESGGASVFGCRWDGRDGEGTMVPSGIYVCLVEYLGPGGGVCRREKACIVVADG